MADDNFRGDLVRGGIAALIISIPLLVWVGQKQSWFRFASNSATPQGQSWRDKIGYSNSPSSPSPSGGSADASASQSLECRYKSYYYGDRTLKIILDEPASQGIFDFTGGAVTYQGVYSPTQITFTSRAVGTAPSRYFTYTIDRRDLSVKVVYYQSTDMQPSGYFDRETVTGSCSISTVDTTQNKI